MATIAKQDGAQHHEHQRNGHANGQLNGDHSVAREPQRLLYLTAPRSCSHLLMRMINIHAQPGLEAYPPEGKQYFMMPSMVTRAQQETFHIPIDDIPAEKTSALNKVRQECADWTEDWIHATEKAGERVFLKEHGFMITNPVDLSERLFGKGTAEQAREVVKIDGKSEGTPSNPTILPDEFLLSFTPSFLIRHPALVAASLKRGMTDAFGLTDSPSESELARIGLALQYFNNRAIYDFFQRNTGKAPVVIDASDVVNSPEIVIKYMETLGLDKDRAQFQWEKYTEEQTAALGLQERRFLDTLTNSDTVVKSKTPYHVDVDAEVKKWKTEFGDWWADTLEKFVKDALPDYEYLYARRLTV